MSAAFRLSATAYSVDGTATLHVCRLSCLSVRCRSGSCHLKERKWIGCVAEQPFGKAFGGKMAEVSVGGTALHFVKCYEDEEIKGGAVYITSKARNFEACPTR